MPSSSRSVFPSAPTWAIRATKFVERFDANSYLTLTMAMDLFDLGSTPKELSAGVRATPAAAGWCVSFSSDWLFPPDQSRDIVNALIANKAPVSYCNVQSTCGHDAFLLPDDLAVYGEMMRAFLDHLGPAPKAHAAVKDEAHGPTSIFHQHRLDYERIVELIPAGASVLDLGCGSGTLLARLRGPPPAPGRRRAGREEDPHRHPPRPGCHPGRLEPGPRRLRRPASLTAWCCRKPCRRCRTWKAS